MDIFKIAVFIGVLVLAETIFGQTNQTVVLQQGVNGYNGCTWTKMLSNSSAGSGNRKYISHFVKPQILASLYEC